MRDRRERTAVSGFTNTTNKATPTILKTEENIIASFTETVPDGSGRF